MFEGKYDNENIKAEVQYALYHSEPKKIESGFWHLPFIQDDEWSECYFLARDLFKSKGKEEFEYRDEIIKKQMEFLKSISVARCARVSYLTHDGKREIEKDIALYEKLVQGMHWSPFEHVAIPANLSYERYGNFIGWKQYRQCFSNENLTEFDYNLEDE